MKDVLEKIARGLALSVDEAYEVAKGMLTSIDEALSAAILMGLRVRGGEASSEIAGFAKALRDFCIKIPIDDRGGKYVDTAGTGGVMGSERSMRPRQPRWWRLTWGGPT